MTKLSELIIEFLRYLLIDKGYSNNTIESYKRDLAKFLEFNSSKLLSINFCIDSSLSLKISIF